MELPNGTKWKFSDKNYWEMIENPNNVKNPGMQKTNADLTAEFARQYHTKPAEGVAKKSPSQSTDIFPIPPKSVRSAEAQKSLNQIDTQLGKEAREAIAMA